MSITIETERKFLVKNPGNLDLITGMRIQQGYLSSHPDRSVRVRIKGDKGYLTIKGKCNKTGMSRLEWEKEIDAEEARQLLDLCEPVIIDKTRYEILWDGKTIELDIFHGENEGLMVAEVELDNELEPFSPPDWVGEEVTGQVKYFNAMLSKNPFKKWDKG